MEKFFSLKFIILLAITLSSSSSRAGFWDTFTTPFHITEPVSCGSSSSVSLKLKDISCLAEKAKYKCTPLGKTLRGVGTYYGKGDKFTGGKTLCEKPFRPMKEKILALQDSLISPADFRNHICGRRAIVTAYDPDDGRCRVVAAELSDTGNLNAKDSDNNNHTLDKLHVDHVNLMGRTVSGPRIFDLSYAAARDLGYVDDGKAWMEVQVCAETAPGAVTPKTSK